MKSYPAIFVNPPLDCPTMLHEISVFSAKAMEAYGQYPLIGALIMLIGIDILTGLLNALADRTLNSTTSFRGMTRKAMVLLIVGTGAVLEPYTGLPLSKLIATFYLFTEAISITENLHKAGVPLPSFLTDTLEKLKGKSDKEKPNIT